MSLLDAYERKARLTPGLLACAPIAFAVAALGLKKFPAIAIAVGVLSAAGGGYALSVAVANFGRRAQEGLWAAWGGAPTTRLLRISDMTTTTTSTVQKEIWRKAIEKLTGVTLASADDEIHRPERADDLIKAAVDQLRLIGQDTNFPLVKTENIQYGYERNLYGFRWIGRLISFACAVAVASVMLLASPTQNAFSYGALLSGVAIDTILFVIWIIVPSANRTKAAGERYAQQLFQAAVKISRQSGTSTNAVEGSMGGASSSDSSAADT